MHAVEYVNQEKLLKSTRLAGIAERVDTNNDFQVFKTVCSLLNMGITSILGPTTGRATDHVQSTCDNKEIPHIQARWDTTQPRHSIQINLHPAVSGLAMAYVDLVKAWGWTDFTIFYDTDIGLSRISALLTMYETKGFTVVVRRLDEKGAGDYR